MAHGPTIHTDTILDTLTVGDTLSTILRHTSRSGMTRHISILFTRGNDTLDLTYAASRVLDMRIANDRGIVVGGCGMDMGFHLVYTLAHALWPTGHRCTGRATEGRSIHRCPSNDHANDHTLQHRPSLRHSDGGYALNQRWI